STAVPNYIYSLSLHDALPIFIASVVLYLVVARSLQVVGPRLSANPSMLSFAVMALLGSLVARAILGNTPTLVGGLIAVTTLLVLEYLLGSLRPGIGRVFTRRGPRPTVVMIHGHVLRWQLRHLGLRSEEHTSELQSRENLVFRLLLETDK